jgi:hypothetical protein
MRVSSITAIALAITAGLFVIAPGSSAAPSEYEYKVGSAELTLLMFDKSTEEKVKKWAKEHRPEMFAAAYAPPEKAPGDKEDVKGGLAGLFSFGTGLTARTGLLLDYYLNQQADLGWDLHIMTETHFVLRRKRS